MNARGTSATNAALLAGLVLAAVVPLGRAAGAEPAAMAGEAAPANAWPMFRGTAAGTGRSASVLRLPLEVIWKRELSKVGFDATPVILEGTVYLGDLDGRFFAVRLDDGTVRWEDRSAAGYSAAAAAGTLVVVGDLEGIVRGFDRATGRERWQHATEGEISGGPTLLPAGGRLPERVLVGSQDTTLRCLALADGRLLWQQSIPDQIRCSPTVAGGRVFLAGCDGRLHVIDAANGEKIGELPIDGPTGTTPAAHGGRVFFGSEGGTFWGIEIAGPSVAWKSAPAAGAQAYRSTAAIAEGGGGPVAIVGSRGRMLTAFTLADGKPAWRQRMRGRVDASPLVVTAESDGARRELAIVGDAAGRVVAVATDSGEFVWEFDAGAGFSASPAAAEGRLLLAGEDGTLWCFGPTP